MDIKVNQTMPVTQTDAVSQAQQTDGSFKFTLASHIEEQDLQVRLTAMMEEITRQGDRISKKMDIKDMRRYRSLVKSFLNELYYMMSGAKAPNLMPTNCSVRSA